MDFLNRLIGSAITPKKPPKPIPANDPQTRLARFKRVFHNVLELCNRPRNLLTEAQLLDQLHGHLERVATLLREESRAPVPHICFQFAASKQIYADVARAAIVSQYEPIVRTSIAVYAALVDSEEEDFLAREHFAKSLMRLVRKVLDGGSILLDTDTETAILELMFTIAAKIRLQPEILPVWFQSTIKPELEDVFIKEKKSFVGITQKDDFPLCYLMIDRVHHEGRIGDFARTGLLYVFEATGRSAELEEWVVSSDLPTLMASGLGALYSQLSRELSILHADAELPAVLAMSDYSTTHPRATAESAFSARHRAHMATFLSYLAFWQDVLDHCRSADVKQTLLDHFQILFLQQLLYPSLLQSSDTDAGSSVAVLTYMTAILESLEYPDLIHMILKYLLAITDEQTLAPASTPQPLVKADGTPRSPTALKRRQSLMLLHAPKDPDDAFEPALFNLADLITNNVSSRNGQTVFAALKLATTLTVRHKRYSIGTLLKVKKASSSTTQRTTGTLERELESYWQLAASLHQPYELDTAYERLYEDTRYAIEAQAAALVQSVTVNGDEQMHSNDHDHILAQEDPLMRSLIALLRTFLTNSIDVNLALTNAIIAIFQCPGLRLEGWVALSAGIRKPEESASPARPWQAYLDRDEQYAWKSVSQAAAQPAWKDESAPLLHTELAALAAQLSTVRERVANLDQLLAGRKNMLQAANLDVGDGPSRPPSAIGSPKPQSALLGVPNDLLSPSRSSSRSSIGRGRAILSKTDHNSAALSSATSPAASRQTSQAPRQDSSTSPAPAGSIFKPPPPETPSTTDVLMQVITFPDLRKQQSTGAAAEGSDDQHDTPQTRSASLNHILTNVVVLQEFVLELIAVIQVRAAVLGEKEVRAVQV